jgi:hypothetical protein
MKKQKNQFFPGKAYFSVLFFFKYFLVDKLTKTTSKNFLGELSSIEE